HAGDRGRKLLDGPERSQVGDGVHGGYLLASLARNSSALIAFGFTGGTVGVGAGSTGCWVSPAPCSGSTVARSAVSASRLDRSALVVSVDRRARTCRPSFVRSSFSFARR